MKAIRMKKLSKMFYGVRYVPCQSANSARSVKKSKEPARKEKIAASLLSNLKKEKEALKRNRIKQAIKSSLLKELVAKACRAFNAAFEATKSIFEKVIMPCYSFKNMQENICYYYIYVRKKRLIN